MWQKPWPYLLLWTILNLVQSYYTGLFNDEAHYWMFSQHLAWGYWDHPPMTPLLVKLGFALIPNELGVRLFIVLANTATVWLLYDTVRPERIRLFFALLFSTFLVHIGWMAAPDTSLLFFTAAFFWAYKRYAPTDSWAWAALLGFITACMAYSKYHGALVILCILMSNPALFKRPSAYLIPLIAGTALVPHLLWQRAHFWPTFRYHLIDRGQEAYEWEFLPEYLGGQWLMFGPLVSILLFAAAYKYRHRNVFERGLKFCLYGILGFFLYKAFRERTEANWTATAVFPLIYLAYHYIAPRLAWRTWANRLAVATLVLAGVFRLYLMWDFLPAGVNPRNEFHHWDAWAADLHAAAAGRPVVFYNTYKGPSKYQFYARGEKAHSLNITSHAGNQYDLLWEEEAALQGKEIFNISTILNSTDTLYMANEQVAQYRIIDDYRSYNRIRIEQLGDTDLHAAPGDTVQLRVRMLNPTDAIVDFSAGKRPVRLMGQVYDHELIARENVAAAMPVPRLAPGEAVELTLPLVIPDHPGRYRYRFAIQVEKLHTGRNANFGELWVTDPGGIKS